MKPKTVIISFDTHTPYLAFRVSKLAAALRKRGLDRYVRLRVVLIAGKEETYGWAGEDFEALYGGVPVTVLSKTFRGLGLRGYFKLSTLKTTLKFFGQLLKWRPKIVLVGGYDRPESMLAAFSSWLFRWRVGVMHDSRFNDAESYSKNVVLERLKSLVVRRYDFFMCSGQECVDYSNFLTGAKRPAYYGGWNVVDHESIGAAAEDAASDNEIYQHLGIDPDRRFFLMPIRFIAKKNVETVLDAYARYVRGVSGDPVAMIICGQGELEDDYRRRISRLGIEKHARIVPWLPYDKVPRASRISNGVILASTHDQWGLIVNEALAAGAPMLVSNRCGAHELIKNGVNGYTFTPKDTEHLSALLTKLATDSSLLSELRSNAVPSMEAFSIDGFLDAYVEAFERFGALPMEREEKEGSTPVAEPAPESL